MRKNHKCPECSSEQFMTDLNAWDIVEFQGDKFAVVDTGYTNDEKIYCRECSEEIDEDLSIKNKKVILKKL